MAESEKTKALDEVTFALLQDRETTHQRDEWAPVLKRLHIKFEAEALATRADSAQRGRPKPAESALEAAWATLERWQSAADFRHFVISSQEFYTVDIYDAGSRRSTKPWRLLSDALCEAVEFIVEFMPLAATPEGT